MSTEIPPLQFIIGHPGAFSLRVLRAFRANQGLLLAGAVAYYTLLSIVPMFALMLIVLSQFIDTPLLLEAVGKYLELATPARSQTLTDHLAAFLANWKVVGLAGLAFLLFFSSLAFTVLENAMSMIFFHRVAIRRRHFLVSATLPYLYILLLAAGLLVVSLVAGWLHTLESGSLPATILYLLGVAGEVLLLTSLYLVMPVGRLAPSHALLGGITATILWEISRHLLVWYFATLSFVNVIYGSLATSIIILLSFEVAAIILLMGAQVIAEYERLDGNLPGTPEEGITT